MQQGGNNGSSDLFAPKPPNTYGTAGGIGQWKANAAIPNIPAAPPAPTNYGGGGGYSGGGYGGGVGSNSVGNISSVAPPAPAPPPPPAPPSIDQWLSTDNVYKQQTDAAHKALQDYMAQMAGQQNQYGVQYAANAGDLADQRKLAQIDTENDYAGRGLETSGLYLKALADLKNSYDKRQSALDAGRADFLSNLQSGLTNFEGTQQVNANQYRNDAIARRAAQYNLPVGGA